MWVCFIYFKVTKNILFKKKSKDDEAAVKALGLELGAEMCRALLALGAPGLHFYTLNTLGTTRAILAAVGLREPAPAADSNL